MPSLTLVVEIDPKKQNKCHWHNLRISFFVNYRQCLIPDIFLLKFMIRTHSKKRPITSVNKGNENEPYRFHIARVVLCHRGTAQETLT